MVNEGGRPSGASINAACRRQKNHKTGPGPGKQTNRPAGDGNAPLLSPAATSLHGKASHTILSHLRLPTNRVRLPPRRGRFTLCSAFELISITKHSVAKTSPSGESTAAGGDRGAFPRASARLYGFYSAKRNCKTPSPLKGKRLTMIGASLCSCQSCSLCTRKGDTTPSEPFEPSEPSRPKGRVHRPPFTTL
jgi:hypothetical protein